MIASLALLGFVNVPDLTDETYPILKRQIMPSEQELDFEDLQWRTSLWTAAQEAQQTDKPILLWAMNGHPLACT